MGDPKTPERLTGDTVSHVAIFFHVDSDDRNGLSYSIQANSSFKDKMVRIWAIEYLLRLLCLCNIKAMVDKCKQISVAVLIKLYLQKQEVGVTCPIGHSLPITKVRYGISCCRELNCTLPLPTSTPIHILKL